MSYIRELAQKTKLSQILFSKITITKKNEMLQVIKQYLLKDENIKAVLSQNSIDVQHATNNGISNVMIDRLMLNQEKIQCMANGIMNVINAPDPIGEVIDGRTLYNGLQLQKKRVPLGVIGIIYESRPNVTVDIAVTCLKASNGVILKGGKEAIHTNKILVDIMKSAISSIGINSDVLSLVEDNSRDVTMEMFKLNQFIDVLIPRGGEALIKTVVDNATIPVIETGVGNCHIYVDKYADINKALNIVMNAKTSRPSVCNSCESLVIHKDIAHEFLPLMKNRFNEKDVKLLGCENTIKIIEADLASEQDFKTEFLDYKISIKIVDNIKEAVNHIQEYTTNHSEAIITDNINRANYFTDNIDAAVVYVNASTRFTDGEEFGMGPEIGISTQKLHARGPMGLKEITSTKYIINGNGQIR